MKQIFGADHMPLACPELCTYTFPSSVSVLELAKETGKVIADLDKSLQQSRLKHVNPHSIANDMFAVCQRYLLLVTLFAPSGGGRNISFMEFKRVLDTTESFWKNLIGYWHWFLFPGERRKISKLHSAGFRAVEYECRKCNVSGWMVIQRYLDDLMSVK